MNVNPLKTEKWLAIAQDTIIEAGKIADVGLMDIGVTFPAPVDDFVEKKAVMLWEAKMTLLPEYAFKKPLVTGRLSWKDVPPADDFTLAVRRNVLFACLVGILPERDFIYDALMSFNYDQGNLLVGAYRKAVVSYMEKMMHINRAGKNGSSLSIKVPRIEDAQAAVVNTIQQGSISFLKKVREALIKE